MSAMLLGLLLSAGLAWCGQPEGKGNPDKGEKPETLRKLPAPPEFTCALSGDSLVLNWGAVEGAKGYHAVAQVVEEDEDLDGVRLIRETADLTVSVALADLAGPGEPLPARVQARVQAMRDDPAAAGVRPKAHGRAKGRYTKWCKAPSTGAGD
jgi:hypothetical protein